MVTYLAQTKKIGILNWGSTIHQYKLSRRQTLNFGLCQS